MPQRYSKPAFQFYKFKAGILLFSSPKQWPFALKTAVSYLGKFLNSVKDYKLKTVAKPQ